MDAASTPRSSSSATEGASSSDAQPACTERQPVESLDAFLEAIQALDPKMLSYQSLGDFLYGFDFRGLDLEALMPPKPAPGSYSRNILTLEPLEVALLRWPPGAESAVHFHQGFYGYVIVLQGEGADIVYRDHADPQDPDQRLLDEQRVAFIGTGGVLHEPDGTIHKIVNPSPEAEMLSLHIYYPALENLDGLVLYDLEGRRTGQLGPDAEAASWTEPEGRFRHIQNNAFQFRTWPQAHPTASHRVVVFKPKPSPQAIQAMLSDYYDEQAEVYDFFDFRHPTRKAYTNRINHLVADAIKARPQVQHLLGVACGTGRRVSDIRSLSGRDLDITGVDMSSGMVAVARERGLDMVQDNWLDADLGERQFDAAIFLYSFGHICSRADRLTALRKLHRHLKPGGLLCIDVFNREDRHEWGPLAMKAFERERLAEAGFEPGDVFYRKADGKATAFLHYFSEEDVRALWEEAGFQVEAIRYVGYTHRSGELLDDPCDGFFFVEATAR